MTNLEPVYRSCENQGSLIPKGFFLVLVKHCNFLRLCIFFLTCTLCYFASSAIGLSANVSISWDKNDEFSIAGYRIHYGSSSGNYEYSADVENYTACTISGLEEGQTYYFAATAYNFYGVESDFSEELIYTVPFGDSVGNGVRNDTTQFLEAEQMDHADGSEYWGYWALWHNGTVYKSMDFPKSGAYRIEITAKGDLAYGVGPEMELLIDGESQGTVFVNTNTPEIFEFEFEVSEGWHDLEIGYNNDFYDSAQGMDRNLYLDKLAISHFPDYF